MRVGSVLFLCFLLTPTAAGAGGFYVPDVGVRPLGRAGAFVARADDGTAAWYNPAGFADQPGTRLDFETAFTKQSVNFQRMDESGGLIGNPVGNTASPKFIPLLGISSDFGLKNFVFALTGYGPYSKDTQFPEDGPQRYSLIRGNSTEGFYQLSAAWRALPWLKLGAAFRGTYFNTNQKAVVAVSDPDGSTDVRVTYDISDRFVPNFIVGLLVSPTPFLDIGFSFRPKPPIDAEGSLIVDPGDFDRLKATVFPSLSINGDHIFVKLETAEVWRAGVRFKQPRFDVEADFVFERWDGFGRLEIRPDNITYSITRPTPQPLPVIIQDRFYGDAWSARIGGDVEVLPGLLTARAGYFYETSAVSDAYLSPSLIDAEKHGFGLGVTARFRWFSFSLAYSHVSLAERLIRGSRSRQVNLTYIALDQQEIAPAVGNGRYRAGWDNVAFGLTLDIDTLAGWVRPVR
jgi:long-chain fatty acid transport protein